MLTTNPLTDLITPSLMFSHDFDNMKVIERWAAKFRTDSQTPTSCTLHIPYKDEHTINPERSRQNWETIENWAYRVIIGECARAPFSASCRLHVPFKTVLGDLAAGRISLTVAQEREFDNYKTVENWANRLARGEC